MKMLLAIAKKELREVVAFSMGARYSEKPFEAGTVSDAVEILKKNPEITTVLCEYPGVGEGLFPHLVVMNKGRPEQSQIRCMVCCHNQPKDDPRLKEVNVIGYIPWMTLVDSLLALLDVAFAPVSTENKNEVSESTRTEDFCEIQTSLLIRVGPLLADIYVKLSDAKFVRLFSEGDKFEAADYRRFLEDKGLEHLYIRKEQIGEFLSKFKEDIAQTVKEDKVSLEREGHVVEAIHEAIHDIFMKLGPTAAVQEIVKSTVSLTLKGMGNSPKLSNVLSRIDRERGRYISSHSMLLPQVACALAASMDWKSESTYQKLTLAAFLHDMSLSNHALAAYQSYDEVADSSEFTEEQKKEYRNHPSIAGEFTKQMTEIPADVSVIVNQHHERPDGTGFPRGLTYSQISPLSSVFIVAHEIVTEIYSKKEAFDLKAFIESKKDVYTGGNFKKILKGLSTIQL